MQHKTTRALAALTLSLTLAPACDVAPEDDHGYGSEDSSGDSSEGSEGSDGEPMHFGEPGDLVLVPPPPPAPAICVWPGAIITPCPSTCSKLDPVTMVCTGGWECTPIPGAVNVWGCTL